MYKNINELLRELKEKPQHPPREYFQLPKVADKSETSTTCGSSWSGEKWSGRNQQGGRDR